MAFEKKVYVKRELYKTELCRHYVLREQCPYKDKCQFAHGSDEIVDIIRHPKYKTELCKGYHSTGFCPYGPRCHFIHGDADDNVRTSSSVAVRSSMGNASRRRWSASTKSGHGKEGARETANDWQNQEDQEMLADWMNKDQDLPDGWMTPTQELAPDPDFLEGHGQEVPVAWPNHLQESDRDWPTTFKKQTADWKSRLLESTVDCPTSHVDQLQPNRMQGLQRKSCASMRCNENWINQFGDVDHCCYLLMKQNLDLQSNFFSSHSQSQENSNSILPSQSFPAMSAGAASDANLEISQPNRPSSFPNQISKPSPPVMKNKNWNQSYLLQNSSIPNSPSDVDIFDWHYQTSASSNVPRNLSPALNMFNCKLAFSSQELISNVSTVLGIFNHNLAANSQSCISNKETGPVF